jgi:monovalent cation/hydrogen antiporter
MVGRVSMHLHVVEIIIALLSVVTALAYLAKQLNVPYPLMLVVAGLGIGFVPGLPEVELRPDLVFLLFLPPLLYSAATQTSWRDFRANLRPITQLAVGLTLFTTVAVAVGAMLVLPGLTWASAFVLGAIVSPPDAIAAGAVASKLHVPRRIVAILEGESLVNDAIALVAYRFAVGAVMTGSFSLTVAAGEFIGVSAGGVAVGLLVGVLVTKIRPRINDYVIETSVSLLTPFLAYLPAERLGVSGVLATVAAGLYVARRIPRITSPATRLRAYAVWDVLVFVLNGLVFILIGLQLPEIAARLGVSARWPQLIGYGLLISAVAIAVRLVWVITAVYVSRWLIPALRKNNPLPPFGSIFLVAWTGMRGIVSLAAALSLPVVTGMGTPFPGRDLIQFTTFVVILVTLLAQGASLPWVIRALGVGDDGSDDRNEEVMARYLSALAAVERIDKLATADGPPVEAIRRVRGEYDDRLVYYSQQISLLYGGAEANQVNSVAAMDNSNMRCTTEGQLRREALGAERIMLLQLRDNGTIADDVLRRVQEALDFEESGLDGR